MTLKQLFYKAIQPAIEVTVKRSIGFVFLLSVLSPIEQGLYKVIMKYSGFNVTQAVPPTKQDMLYSTLAGTSFFTELVTALVVVCLFSLELRLSETLEKGIQFAVKKIRAIFLGTLILVLFNLFIGLTFVSLLPDQKHTTVTFYDFILLCSVFISVMASQAFWAALLHNITTKPNPPVVETLGAIKEEFMSVKFRHWFYIFLALLFLSAVLVIFSKFLLSVSQSYKYFDAAFDSYIITFYFLYVYDLIVNGRKENFSSNTP